MTLTVYPLEGRRNRWITPLYLVVARQAYTTH